MRLFNCSFPLALALVSGLAVASEYAGQETRVLKSLSAQDIADLRNGRGWGLAKPAELNGLPGPVHLLELKSRLALSESQITKIQVLYEDMNRQARAIGAKYIEQERALELELLQPDVSVESLSSAVNAAAQTLAELRLTHLKTHLQTSELLSKYQLEKYAALRGYTNEGACDNPPEGHDPEMWKRHNNCL